MNVQVMERLAIEHHLRSALENKEFFLVYQPQIDLSTSRNLRYGGSDPLEPAPDWRNSTGSLHPGG